MLEQHAAHGVRHLIQYSRIDATDIPYTDEFDIVVFKSILGGIGRHHGKGSQAKAIKEMYKALKPNGELLFAENLSASWLHRTLRRKFVQWGSAWRYVSVAEMQELLSPFSEMKYRTLGVTGALGRGEIQRRMLGLLDQAILNYVVPESWRYIIIGVARK